MGNTKTLKVDAIQCPHCRDIVFSRARHDFRSCTCGQSFIDGGFDYVRVGFRGKQPKQFRLEIIGLTEAKLYHDWNDPLENQFGVVHSNLSVSGHYRYTYNAKGKFYRYLK